MFKQFIKYLPRVCIRMAPPSCSLHPQHPEQQQMAVNADSILMKGSLALSPPSPSSACRSLSKTFFSLHINHNPVHSLYVFLSTFLCSIPYPVITVSHSIPPTSFVLPFSSAFCQYMNALTNYFSVKEHLWLHATSYHPSSSSSPSLVFKYKLESLLNECFHFLAPLFDGFICKTWINGIHMQFRFHH